jgi:hypothetical protein
LLDLGGSCGGRRREELRSGKLRLIDLGQNWAVPTRSFRGGWAISCGRTSPAPGALGDVENSLLATCLPEPPRSALESLELDVVTAALGIAVISIVGEGRGRRRR